VDRRRGPAAVRRHRDRRREAVRLHGPGGAVGRPAAGPRPAADEVVADTRDVFPPAVPEGLLVLQEEGGNRLVWNPGLARDLAGYRVWARDGDGEWRQLADGLTDPAFFDRVAPAGRRYAVTAVDAAGNESGRAER
jgi:hypothetical protein